MFRTPSCPSPSSSFLHLRCFYWLGRKFYCPSLQKFVAIADDIMQVIRIKRLILQFRFQEVLSTSKAELWCELTIAILIYLAKYRSLFFVKNIHWRLGYEKGALYMQFSFVEFILMKGKIIVFDFGKWIPLLTYCMKPLKLGIRFNAVQKNPAACHSISNVHDSETSNDA